MATLGKHKAIRRTYQPRTTLELLVALQLSLTEELPKLLFDPLAFRWTSWVLLGKMKVDFDPLLLIYFDEGSVAEEAGSFCATGIY
jgi:hypothetical protein